MKVVDNNLFLYCVKWTELIILQAITSDKMKRCVTKCLKQRFPTFFRQLFSRQTLFHGPAMGGGLRRKQNKII